LVDVASLLSVQDVGEPLSPRDAAEVAEFLSDATGAAVYVRSVAAAHRALWAVGKREGAKVLLTVCSAGTSRAADSFAGQDSQATVGEDPLRVRVSPADREAAAELRRWFPFVAPCVVGLRRSFGMGDRLGNATPGHVRAVRGSGVFPVLAQQSIREMRRTGRSAQDVMDSATWGVFQSGYREGFGADADHLKTTDDVDSTLAAGFVMFTVDPGDHVDTQADRLGGNALRECFESLPWDELHTKPDDLLRAYEGRSLPLNGTGSAGLARETLVRAAVKYGRAIAHTASMYRYLRSRAGKGEFELEMSVDETDSPTTAAEHAYVALELRRLGVEFVSLAPRFVGRFEKGVDYQGSIDEFSRCLRDHVSVARELGPYKLSVHSGSDKFSVYPAIADAAGQLVHVKTAGTSYLEAVRVVGAVAPDLFREILAFALGRYDDDRRSYHVSGRKENVPDPATLRDEQLPGLLDRFDARQVLHVTYGSVLTAVGDSGASRFRTRMMAALDEHEEDYAVVLEEHLRRHIDPFRLG